MKKLVEISPEEIQRYARSRKVSSLDAYRALLSQKLIDLIATGDTTNVLRELVFQMVGDGVKEVTGPVSVIAPGGNA